MLSFWSRNPRYAGFFLLLAICLNAAAANLPNNPTTRWWKGNLHTHTLWSDGDDYPEMVVDWYKSHGYHFLAISDHNVLHEGRIGIQTTNNHGGGDVLKKYIARFGSSWVEQLKVNGRTVVRLKTLAEYRKFFEQPDRFLLIQSEEITDQWKAAPIHLNATNLRELIKPQGGDTVLEVLQKNINAVFAQRVRTGQPMFPHINHPNFHWAITAEELMQVQGEKFFEVYNGHPNTHNRGDDKHASLDRVWDIMLTMRLTQLGLGTMFGMAVDDAHNYHRQRADKSNPGRGWVMVHAAHLTPESLIQAMEAGEFYASSGVRLKEVCRETQQYRVLIDPEPGVTYTTQFFGTRTGFDFTSAPVLETNGIPLRVTCRYSPEIGAVLEEVPGLAPVYKLQGNEIYVRAKVISSKRKAHAVTLDETEMAWTQPLVTGVK